MFLLWTVLGANERGVIPCFRALGISRSVAELCAGVSHTHRGSEQPCSPGSHRSHRATAQLGLPTASEEPNFTERRKRSALLTWNESEPSLCDLSVQPVKELNKQPREHTPKHLSLREQLLQWGQGCQPTNPAGTTHGTGLVQPGDTHRVNFSCRTQSDSLGLALQVLTDKPPVLQFPWVILTCLSSPTLVQCGFFISAQEMVLVVICQSETPRAEGVNYRKSAIKILFLHMGL